MGKETTRKLTRDEKFAIQQSGRLWRDWLYWKESECENTFIAVNKYHLSQTKRFRRTT